MTRRSIYLMSTIGRLKQPWHVPVFAINFSKSLSLISRCLTFCQFKWSVISHQIFPMEAYLLNLTVELGTGHSPLKILPIYRLRECKAWKKSISSPTLTTWISSAISWHAIITVLNPVTWFCLNIISIWLHLLFSLELKTSKARQFPSSLYLVPRVNSLLHDKCAPSSPFQFAWLPATDSC